MSRRRRRGRRRPPKFDITHFNEDQPSTEDGVIDTNCIAQDSNSSYSINSDVASQIPPSPQPPSSSSRPRWSFRNRRKKKRSHSPIPRITERIASRNMTDSFDQYEEKVKTCEEAQDEAHAKELLEELNAKYQSIKSWARRLQNICQDKADEHRENPQQKPVSMSNVPVFQSTSTEVEDEICVRKEPCDMPSQPIRLSEDKKLGQCEQAEHFGIECCIEVNELLRYKNDTQEHQPDSGLVAYSDQPDSGLVGCSDCEGDGKSEDLKGTQSGLEAQVKVLNEDVKKLRDHSKEQSRQVLKYKQQAEVSTFREKQLEAMERKNYELEELLVSTRRNLQQQIQELQNEVAALNAQLAVYKADFDQERQDRAEAHSRMAELEKKGARVKGQIDLEREAYHQEHQDLKHDYQIARSQLEQHQQSLSAVEEVNENLRQEIQAKSSQVKQYAKEVDRLKRELEETRNRISERTATPTDASGMKQSKLEDLYKTAQDDIQYLSEENSHHQDRIEMLEREIEQLKNLQRISESSLSPVHTPYGRKVVDVNPPEQPLHAEEALHKEPYIHHDPVSPLTGQKQSQLAPQAVHVMVDELEVDGPNPYSKVPLHLPKHPANQKLSPERESVTPKQMQPVQREKVLQADVHAPPVYVPPHVAPLPQPSYPQQLPQAVVMPVNTRNDQLYSPHVSDSPGCDQLSQQSTEHYQEVEDSRQLEDSTAQFENPLVKELDDEIHQQAAEVIQEVSGGRREVKTDHQRPFDPNLVCPMCRRQFRIGEIQKFKRHVNTCTGTDD